MSLLSSTDLCTHYGDFQALFGINLCLEEHQTLAIIGSNGAGKSTFLQTLAGLQPASSGSIRFDGQAICGLAAHRITALGLALVPEGRRLFPSLSVEENLRLGGYTRRKGPWTLPRIYDLFPALLEHKHRPGTALSGGQQQMVAIGRALLSNPRVLLCDEISLGLAPIIVRDIYAALPRIKAEGTSVVLVEQDVAQAMRVADRLYCFQEGRVSLEGHPTDLSRDQISSAYFGL